MSAYSSSPQVLSSHSPSFFATRVLEPSAFTRMSFFDFHHLSWKAALIILSYLLNTRPLGDRLIEPSTLSVGDTFCLASGRTLATRLP